jgi:hypothetical protein
VPFVTKAICPLLPLDDKDGEVINIVKSFVMVFEIMWSSIGSPTFDVLKVNHQNS